VGEKYDNECPHNDFADGILRRVKRPVLATRHLLTPLATSANNCQNGWTFLGGSLSPFLSIVVAGLTGFMGLVYNNSHQRGNIVHCG
jgi:hypothetical protein